MENLMLKTLSPEIMNAEDNIYSQIQQLLLDYMSKEQEGDIKHWGIRKEDISSNNFLKLIEKCDLPEEFYRNLLADAAERKDEKFWNESVQDLIKQLSIFTSDEKGDIIELDIDEPEKSRVDKSQLDALIGVHGGYGFRAKDIKEADAGANFVLEDELYNSFHVKNPWVIPWYNVNGHSYRKVRGADRKKSVLANDYKLDFSREKNFNSPSWMRLLLPQNKRKVEIEDLDRNFWVIAQVSSAMSAFLFDEDGPMQKILRGMLNEVTQLWENTLVLWGTLAQASKKPYFDTIHTETIYVQPGSGQYHMKYDNILENQELYLPQLRELKNVYIDSNLCILLCVREGNYYKNFYSKEYYPYIYTYDRNKDIEKIIPIEAFGETDNRLVVDPSALGNKLIGFREYDELKYEYIMPFSRTSISEDSKSYTAAIRTTPKITAIYNNDIEISNFRIVLEDIGGLLSGNNAQGGYAIYNKTKDVIKMQLAIWSNLEYQDITPDSKPNLTGFYLGEMPSTCKATTQVNHELKIIHRWTTPRLDWKTTDEFLKDKEINETDSYIITKLAEKDIKREEEINDFCLYTANHNCAFWGETSKTFDYSHYAKDELNNDVVLCTLQEHLKNNYKPTLSVEDVNTMERCEHYSISYSNSAALYNPLTKTLEPYEDYQWYSGYWYNGVHAYHVTPTSGAAYYSGEIANSILYYEGDKILKDNWYIKYIQCCYNNCGKEEIESSHGNGDFDRFYIQNVSGNPEYFLSGSGDIALQRVNIRVKVTIFGANGQIEYYDRIRMENEVGDATWQETKSFGYDSLNKKLDSCRVVGKLPEKRFDIYPDNGLTN